MRDNGCTYTFTAPAATLTLDPATRMYVDTCSFNSDFAAEIAKRPQDHGGFIDPGTEANGVWDASIRTYGTRAQLAASRLTLMQAFQSAYGAYGAATLQWVDGDGASKQLVGYSIMKPAAAIDTDGGWLWHVQLGTEKPCAEDAVATTITSTPITTGGGGFVVPLTVPFTLLASSGGQVTVTNGGDHDAYPVFKVQGPLVNPVVRNLATGKQLVFAGSIGGGDYWLIDTFAGTVLLNGVTPVYAIDVSQSQWFTIPAGASNAVQLSGSSFTSSTLLTALMRSAWG